MTGPEHYKEAEGLISDARSHPPDERSWAGLMQLAQVHAMLALTAATADWFTMSGTKRAARKDDWETVIT
jgi:hypothetical protein